MQPIERVGVFALLFLVVTVVAVVLWDKSPDDPESATAATARERSESNTPRNARDPKSRGVGQLDDPLAREKPLAKAPMGPREALPTASTRDEVLLPATRTVQDESAATELASAPESELAASLEAPLKPGKRELGKRDLGPDPQTPVKTASAPTTVVVPRVVERTPTAAIHVVKAGETLSDIATARLGQASRWKEIADLNGVDPAKLHVGKELRLPADALVKVETPVAKSDAQAAVPSKSTYRVVPGDSLWKIAERELGDGDRWKEIASANPGLDANKLVAGATLNLPAGRRPASTVPAKGPQTSAKAPTTVASAGTAKKKGTVR